MTPREDFDEEGIIGSRPKRAAASVDLGPLFSGVEEIQIPPEIPVKDAAGAPIGRVAGLTFMPDGSISAAIELNDAGRELLDQMGTKRESYLDDDDEDEVPIDPRKPEPPTKAERLEAIERVKAATLEPLVRRARARIPDPRERAGVTADDVWELAQGIPAAALLGSAPRAWSWTGPWLGALARAGTLAAYMIEGIPVTRRATTRDASHGNAHRVYLHPDDPRGLSA